MDVALKVVPIIGIFALGSLLRHWRVAKKEEGDFLLRLNFYVGLPALTILSLTNTSLNWHLALFPLIGVLTVVGTWLLTKTVSKRFTFDRQTLGVFIISSMIINTGFSLPFLIAAYGDDGLIRKVIFDLGSDTMIYTVIYYIACKFGHQAQDTSLIVKKVLVSPILFSFILGFILSLCRVELPAMAVNFLTPLSHLVIASILLALGIYFNPRQLHVNMQTLTPLLIRSLGGLALGLLLVNSFGLTGIDRQIAIILASAPVGYMTLTLSSLEKLNVEYAAQVVSLSVFSGLLYIPALLFAFTLF